MKYINFQVFSLTISQTSVLSIFFPNMLRLLVCICLLNLVLQKLILSLLSTFYIQHHFVYILYNIVLNYHSIFFSTFAGITLSTSFQINSFATNFPHLLLSIILYKMVLLKLVYLIYSFLS